MLNIRLTVYLPFSSDCRAVLKERRCRAVSLDMVRCYPPCLLADLLVGKVGFRPFDVALGQLVDVLFPFALEPFIELVRVSPPVVRGRVVVADRSATARIVLRKVVLFQVRRIIRPG